MKVFAAWNKDATMREYCASGGVFSSLAEYILANGGVVVGAAYEGDFSVKHIIVDNLPELERMKRSKYVQSDIGGLFPRVKTLLEQNRLVLFSGTPCQINAFKSYLKHEYENLICCALFCYGVPEPRVYRAYLGYLEKRFHSKISSINFKDKRYGWDFYTTDIHFENGKNVCRFGGDSYKKLMGLGYSLCLPCLTCSLDFRITNADIMLGDFYTIADYLSISPPKNGVNCVVVLSEKAERILGELRNMVFYAIDDAKFEKNEKTKARNFSLEKRKEFLHLLECDGYEIACQRVGFMENTLTFMQRLMALKHRFFR